MYQFGVMCATGPGEMAGPVAIDGHGHIPIGFTAIDVGLRSAIDDELRSSGIETGLNACGFGNIYFFQIDRMKLTSF